MSRRVNRVPYHLDSKGIRSLPPEDVRTILLGSDDLTMRGGRRLLTKILKGSRAKDEFIRRRDPSAQATALCSCSTPRCRCLAGWSIESSGLSRIK
jgi:hypothetical protein